METKIPSWTQVLGVKLHLCRNGNAFTNNDLRRELRERYGLSKEQSACSIKTPQGKRRKTTLTNAVYDAKTKGEPFKLLQGSNNPEDPSTGIFRATERGLEFAAAYPWNHQAFQSEPFLEEAVNHFFKNNGHPEQPPLSAPTSCSVRQRRLTGSPIGNNETQPGGPTAQITKNEILQICLYETAKRRRIPASELATAFKAKVKEIIGEKIDIRTARSFIKEWSPRLLQRTGRGPYTVNRQEAPRISKLRNILNAAAGATDPPIASPALNSDGSQRIGSKEPDHYEPFINTINAHYFDRYVNKKHRAFKTDRAGGPKFGNPDVTLVDQDDVDSLGTVFEVITFEIKQRDTPTSENAALAMVLQTLAYTRFAHKSYLALKTSKSHPKVEKLCRHFGVGLLTFADPSNWDTYQFYVESDNWKPNKAEVDHFLNKYLEIRNFYSPH